MFNTKYQRRNMKTKRILLFFICVLVSTSILSACSMARRKKIEITPFSKQLSLPPDGKIIVKFESVLPGKPLNETVWDNVSGPFWDVKESKQIGFTQNYKLQFFAIPPVLLPAAAKSGANLIDSRIVIPFGNMFSGKFTSAVENITNGSKFCFDQTCLSKFSNQNILKLKIDQFLVWEAPLNHLNFYVKGVSTYSKNGQINKYNFEHSLLTQKVGGVLSTHNSFIKAMNTLTNKFTEDVSADILENTLK